MLRRGAGPAGRFAAYARPILVIKISRDRDREELGTWSVGISYARPLLIVVSSSIDYIHIDDEPGSAQMAFSYEAVARHAIADPDLRGAVFGYTERLGCRVRADRSSPSLLPAWGGGGEPTRSITEGRGPASSRVSPLGSRACLLIIASSKKQMANIEIRRGAWSLERRSFVRPTPSNFAFPGMKCTRVDDELGNRRIALSHEAGARHAITDPDLRSAVCVNSERAGCSAPEAGSSPSLLATRGGGSKPMRRTAQGHGPVSSRIFLLGSEACLLIIVS